MHLPLSTRGQPLHARAPVTGSGSILSPGRPKFLPTHWPIPGDSGRVARRLDAEVAQHDRPRWSGLSLKILAVALCYALVADAEAAEPHSVRYGDPQVLSALGEPVDIRIPVSRREVNADARFMLGQEERSLDLPVLRHGTVQLEQDAGGWALRIRSSRRSIEPAMAVVVQEVVGRGIVSRTLPVLFDPEPVRPAATQAASPAQPVPSVSAMVPALTDHNVAVERSLPASAMPLRRPVPHEISAISAASSTRPLGPARAEVRHTLSEGSGRSADTHRSEQPAPAPRNGTRETDQGLRLTLTLESARNIESARPGRVADRESLRWLQRQMLGGGDDLGLAALQRQAAQLLAQVEQLEVRVAQSGRPSVAQAGQGRGSLSSDPGAGATTVGSAAPASSSRPTEMSIKSVAFAQLPPASQPWGLPLLAGLMLGAGYWSGRRGRPAGTTQPGD